MTLRISVLVAACSVGLSASLAGAGALSGAAAESIGTPVTRQEARSITGGACVDYPATTSCTLSELCGIINGEAYSTNPGDESFSDSYSCGTYEGASCGVYAESQSCSAE